MKIVHVEDYFDPSAGYQINEMILAGRAFGDDTYIITSKDMSPFHKALDPGIDAMYEEKYGVKIIRLDAYAKLSTRILFKGLWPCIDAIQPDLLYLHGIGDFKDLVLWRRKKPYKIVRDCHMSWVASVNRFRKLFYQGFRLFFSGEINRSDKYASVFALGVEEHEYLENLGIDAKKIQYLPHGYNEEVMHYDEGSRQSIRKRYGFAESDVVIAYIGKFDNNKRPDIVLDIVASLGKKYIEDNHIRLLFIGSKKASFMPAFDEKLASYAELLGNRIVIDEAKPFNELYKYFSAAEICLFPKETTLSSIHAQVCGCSVIMEHHKSNAERVVAKEHLFEINNTEAGTKVLRKIISEKDYLKEKNLRRCRALKVREYKHQIVALRAIVEK